MRPSRARCFYSFPRRSCIGQSWSLPAASWQPSSPTPGTRSLQPAGRWKEFLRPGHLQRPSRAKPHPWRAGVRKLQLPLLGAESERGGSAGNPVPPQTLPRFQAGLPPWPQPTPVYLQDPLLPSLSVTTSLPPHPAPSPGLASPARLSTPTFRACTPTGRG